MKLLKVAEEGGRKGVDGRREREGKEGKKTVAKLFFNKLWKSVGRVLKRLQVKARHGGARL